MSVSNRQFEQTFYDQISNKRQKMYDMPIEDPPCVEDDNSCESLLENNSSAQCESNDDLPMRISNNHGDSIIFGSLSQIKKFYMYEKYDKTKNTILKIPVHLNDHDSHKPLKDREYHDFIFLIHSFDNKNKVFVDIYVNEIVMQHHHPLINGKQQETIMILLLNDNDQQETHVLFVGDDTHKRNQNTKSDSLLCEKKLALPGGYIIDTEDDNLYECIKRELVEETGFVIENYELHECGFYEYDINLFDSFFQGRTDCFYAIKNLPSKIINECIKNKQNYFTIVPIEKILKDSRYEIKKPHLTIFKHVISKLCSEDKQKIFYDKYDFDWKLESEKHFKKFECF
jgi:8-oxo-dGTP pyrophosphatase MutT (NUDIX family)